MIKFLLNRESRYQILERKFDFRPQLSFLSSSRICELNNSKSSCSFKFLKGLTLLTKNLETNQIQSAISDVSCNIQPYVGGEYMMFEPKLYGAKNPFAIFSKHSGMPFQIFMGKKEFESND